MTDVNANVLVMLETLEGVANNVNMCEKLANDYVRDPILIQKLKNISAELESIGEHILKRVEA